MRLCNVCVLFLICMATAASAALTEQQTINEGINGSSGWVASFGTAEQQVRSDNGYLSIAGRGGAGQYFVVNQKSNRQMATCTALKSSNWGAFGVTYYDSNWNEVHVVRKEVTNDIRAGQPERRQAIGIDVPANAAYGFLWVWNDDLSGYTQVDNFRLVNYFPEENATFDGSQPAGDQYTQTFPAGANLLINGRFETQGFERDEYWNVSEIDNSVYYQQYRGLGSIYGLHVGSPAGNNLLYQRSDLQANRDYTIRFTGGRTGGFGGGSPWAIVGIDFFDVNGNSLGSASKPITNGLSTGKFPSSNDTFIEFTTPAGTVSAVTWVWVEAGDIPLWILSIDLGESDVSAPVIADAEAFDVLEEQARGYLDVRITDDTKVDSATYDNNDFVVVGPNGVVRETTYSSNPFFGPDYYIEGGFTAADNGTHYVYYNSGEIADVFGNAANLPFPGATSQIVASFEVNIGAVGE